MADIHGEYKRLHESILIGFQNELRETALLVAGFTAEQIAYTLVGGLALKGAWVLIGKGAPTILATLSKGGKVAVRWFRDLLVRAPMAEREALLRLWAKAETQGINALTAAEKQQFQVLMSRLEKVLESPIARKAREELRKWSRMRAQDVERVMEAINRHYRRWFDTVYDPKDAAALARAEQSVLSEIAQLKARLSP